MQNTSALEMNSASSGFAGCSRLSIRSVRGLAPSRRLRSFWRSSREWDRLWTLFVGAMMSCALRVRSDYSNVACLSVSSVNREVNREVCARLMLSKSVDESSLLDVDHAPPKGATKRGMLACHFSPVSVLVLLTLHDWLT
jgi:hypothetical protein